MKRLTITLTVALFLVCAWTMEALPFSCQEIRGYATKWGYVRPDKSSDSNLFAKMNQEYALMLKKAREDDARREKNQAIRKLANMSPDQIDDDYDPDQVLPAPKPTEVAKQAPLLVRQAEYFLGLIEDSKAKMKGVCTPEVSFSGPLGDAQGEIWHEALKCYQSEQIDYTELFVGAKLAEAANLTKVGIPFAQTSNKMVVIRLDMLKFNGVIAQTYPGSNFNCETETGTFVNGNVTESYTAGRLTSRETRAHNGLVEKYGVADDGRVSISVSDGFGGNGQSAFAVLDLNSPEKSYVNDLKLNLTASQGALFRNGTSVTTNRLMEAATKLYFSKYAARVSLSAFLGNLLLSADARDELFMSLGALVQK